MGVRFWGARVVFISWEKGESELVRCCKRHLAPERAQWLAAGSGGPLQTYTFALLPSPNLLLFAARAATRNPLPKRRVAPANTCAPMYRPPWDEMMAPAIGGPVSVAKLTMVKIMPMRTPVFLRSVVRLVRPAGNKDCIPPPAVP